MTARAIKSPYRAAAKPTAKRYARSTYSRNSKPQNFSLAETMIFQGIVCSIVLCLALVLCVVKTPGTQALRMSLKSALTSNIEAQTPGENPMLTFAKSINSSVKNLFNKEPATTPEQNYQDTQGLSDEIVPAFSDAQAESEFRIDEDILNSIYNSAVDNPEIAEDLSEKKLMVPEN